MRLGERGGALLYLAAGLAGCGVTVAVLFATALNHSRLSIPLTGMALFLVYLILHIRAFKSMKHIGRGRELNKVLGLTARNMLVYGIITSFNIILLGIA